MADTVKEILARPIQLADQLTKSPDKARSFKHECAELKAKSERLAALLRQAARFSKGPYERPARLIIDNTEQVLDKAVALVTKCRVSCIIKRMFATIPSGAFRKALQELDNSIGDVSWLLRFSDGDRDDEGLGLPPIAGDEPVLCRIWKHVAILSTGTLKERSDAASSLASLARAKDRYAKMIVEEGGVLALLKLDKERYWKGKRMQQEQSDC